MVAVVVVLTGLLRGNAAALEPRFGERGQNAVSAERLMGYIHVRTTESFLGQTGVTSSDSFTLLGNPLGLSGSAYGWPRIGLDRFVAQNLSLGAALAFFHLSREGGAGSGFLFAPRIGYLATLSDRFAFWGRLGFTYERVTGDAAGSSRTQNIYAMTVEAPLVIVLAPHVAASLGPTLDWGVGGDVSTSGVGSQPRLERKYTDFGVQVGLILSF